jgi:hypothetical protein
MVELPDFLLTTDDALYLLIAVFDNNCRSTVAYRLNKTVFIHSGNKGMLHRPFHLTGIQIAVQHQLAAVANAQDLGAQVGDQLTLVTINGVDSSVAATAEKDGTAQLDANVAVITVDAEGKISSCYIDALQAKVNFDTTGAITTDLTAAMPTKNELGDAYNMVAFGQAKAEWNVQAADFCKYVTGMTADEVAGIAVKEDTKPADGTDLVAMVTIKIGTFQDLIAKAFAK